MTQELTIFKFKERPVRIHRDDNGEPWFCLKDICDTLQIKNNRNVVNRVRNTDVRTMDTGTETGIRSMLFVNETGLYDAILESRKPEAKEFRYWVTSEVLPSIRKTGSYSVERPDLLALKQAVDVLINHEERLKRLESKQTALMSPVQEVSPRLKIVRMVREYSHKTSISYEDCWRNLYREFMYRYHIDLPIRAANRKATGVQIAEEMGCIGDLYSLAAYLFA